MNDKINSTINVLPPFKKICMSIGELPASYLETMTYYESLLWLTKYLQETIIPTINNNAEAVKELQELFVKLQKYVNDYFDNLDVQEEINNKLDIMAEDGTLSALVGYRYLITENLPENPTNNTIYGLIDYENNNEYTLPDSNYELLENAKEESIQNLENNILRVGTFNIQNPTGPYVLKYDGLYKWNKLKRVFNKLKCNILGINELWSDYLYPINEFLLNDYYDYSNMCVTWHDIFPMCDYGEGTFSNIRPIDYSTKIYDSYHAPEYQGYIKSHFTYDNKNISFYCTHLCYNDTQTALNQLTELYNDLASDDNPYKIIVGDFNLNLENYETYLEDFIDLGYKIVNTGQYKTGLSSNIAIDEIMVSNNIDIIESGMLTLEEIENTSDHLPLWANLELKEDE